MDLITIFQALLRWGIPALIGGAGLLFLFFFRVLLFGFLPHAFKSHRRQFDHMYKYETGYKKYCKV